MTFPVFVRALDRHDPFTARPTGDRDDWPRVPGRVRSSGPTRGTPPTPWMCEVDVTFSGHCTGD